MGAVWMRFRAELRTRWRAWLGYALLVGLAGGAVMALAAGARRTDSAYARFLRAQRADDVTVINYEQDGTAVFDFDKVAKLPQVADSAHAGYEFISPGDSDAVSLIPLDDPIGTEVDRWKILEGRRPDPDRVDEVAVSFEVAEQNDLHVGSTFPYLDPEVTPEPGSPEFERLGVVDRRLVRQAYAAVPGNAFTVVGIEAAPGEFPPQGTATCCVHHSEAFGELRLFGGEVLAVRVAHDADVDDFLDALETRSGGRPVQALVQKDQAEGVERSIRYQAIALWLLAALVVVAALLVFGQVIARQSFLESTDYPTLAALGTTRHQRTLLGLARVLGIGLVGAAIAVAVAVVCSPLLPTGLAKIAEPDPGVRVDGAVLAIGTALTVVVLLLIAAVPAWRAARVGVEGAEVTVRPSRVTRLAARVGAGPTVVAGVRMALEPGRGRTAVPVRSTLAAIALGLTTLVAALSVGASLTHLVDTPRLYGVAWDLQLTSYGFGPEVATVGRDAARASPEIRSVAFGEGGFELEIDDTTAVALVLGDGDVAPPIIEGRAPVGAREVALSPKTRDRLDVDVGEEVDVRLAPGDAVPMRVVGDAVMLPPFGDPGQFGSSAWLAPRAAARLVAPRARAEAEEPVDFRSTMFLQLAPGANPEAVRDELNEEMQRVCARRGGTGCDDPRVGEGLSVVPIVEPTDVVNFGRVRSTPFLLGAILAGLAAATLALMLVSAVRRRRRDLAVLKTLGFTHRQVTATVLWQATTLVGLSLLVAVPVGIVIGRLVWRFWADDLGIVFEPRVPVAALVLIGVTGLVLANCIAALPARAAARTRPATVLRSE